MKIKHLLVAAFAAVAMVFTSCEKEEDLGAAQVTVNPTDLTFEAAASSQNVTLKATRAWTATAPEWIALSATSGDASASEKTISVTVEENTGNNRTGEVVFTIGLAKATLKVTQAGPGGEIKAGSGTLSDPYSVAGAIAYVESLGNDVQSEGEVYVKGVVSAVEEAFSSQFGNGTFYITDDGSASSPAFYVYRVKFLGNQKWELGNTQIAVGDQVVICSRVVNYKGNKPETVMLGSSAEGGPYAGYVYSLNGKTEDQKQEVDYSKAEAKTVAEFIAAADKTTFYKLTGKVGGSINTQYGNFDLTDETGTIYVYGTKNIADYASKLVDGATVTLAATYDYYEKNQKHEAVNAYILSIEGGEAPDYSNAPAKTVADFIAAADTQTYYKLTGTVGGSINTTYGNFDLTDETGTIYVYGVKNWSEYKDKVSEGTTLVLAAQYQLYQKEGQADKHEAVNSYILSCEGGTPHQDSEPKGSGTLEDPYNAAKAIEVASALESGAKTETDVYIAGKIAAVKYSFDVEHGTATFGISDDGTTSTTVFTCYSVYYLGNRSWAEGDTQVAVGDEVIIYGKLTNYGGNTPETASKEAYIYSLNGVTDGGDPAPTITVTSLKQTESGFSATWTTANLSNFEKFVWNLYRVSDEAEDGIVYTAAGDTATDVMTLNAVAGTSNAHEAWNEALEVGTTYYFVVSAWDGTSYIAQNDPEKSKFVARDMSNTGSETMVTFSKEQLAAAACNGAKVDMDEVISFTNSSDYGSTTVTELRIYKGKTLTISAAGASITKIEFTCTANGTAKQGPGCWGAGAPSGYTFDANGKTGEWNGSEASVAFTATDNQVRITELKVTYAK